MVDDRVDKGRRRFLTAVTSGVGAVGGVFAATPFVLSMTPSERAKAAGAPVEIDISKLQARPDDQGNLAGQSGLGGKQDAGDAGIVEDP